MSLVIRAINEEEFEEIILLFQEFALFEKRPEKMKNSVEQLKEEKEYFNCLVAIEDGKIVGFATYFFAYFSWIGKSMYLDDLYVTSAYRKQGIGKKLLDTVIALAQTNNCKRYAGKFRTGIKMHKRSINTSVLRLTM